MKKSKILLSTFLAGSVILAGCSSKTEEKKEETKEETKKETKEETKEETTTKKEVNKPKAKYIISGITVENDGSSIYVTGVLTNNTGSAKGYIHIIIPAYDKAGNKVGEAFATATDIAANGTWKFKAPYLGTEKDVTFKIKDLKVTGF